MFKRFAVPAVAVALAAIAGYTTPVFGHGNQTSAKQYREIGADTVLAAPDLPSQGSFVNYETPHVHPLDISPNGVWLAVVNTADGYVEIFYINQTTGQIQHAKSVKVGVDPVSARWRSDDELWVVNHISDTISVIDRPSGMVTKSLVTYRLQDPGSGLLEADPNGDEPADVVFNAGDTKAYVSCSRTDYIQVWDLATYALESEIYLDGEDPRVMDIYNNKLYTAIFESGNGTTLLFGESAGNGASTAMPPNTAVLNHNQRTDHPYYWDGPGEVGYEVYAIYPPPNTGQLAADFVLGDFGSYATPHGTVDIVELNNADLARYEAINGAGSWDMLNTERYYFSPPLPSSCAATTRSTPLTPVPGSTKTGATGRRGSPVSTSTKTASTMSATAMWTTSANPAACSVGI